MMQPLEVHPEPERLGQVHFDDMTKRTNFWFPIFSLIDKHIRFFVLEQAFSTVWQTRGTTVSGKHLTQFDRLPRGETPDSSRWSRSHI